MQSALAAYNRYSNFNKRVSIQRFEFPTVLIISWKEKHPTPPGDGYDANSFA